MFPEVSRAMERATAVDSGPGAEAERRSAEHESPPIAGALATIVCALAAVGGWLLAPGPASLACYVVAYLAGGIPTLRSAVGQLMERRLNIDLLMIVAAVGAAVLGDWNEGAILLFLFSLSNTLESYAMYRTTRSIDALMRLRPREASRIRDGVESRVPTGELALGDLVHVRPGEQFPVDGVVEDGETWADEASITGESVPVGKRPGDEVFAATINGQGSVRVRMTRAVADTAVERIVRLVREAQASQTPTQRLIESWQAPYVAIVLVASLAVYVGTRWIHLDDAYQAFYHAMVVLVACSPCAVVIGSPAVTLSAIARAARMGVLFKGGVHLEQLGEVNAIAFDKTGTLTQGKPSVTDVWTADGMDPDRLLCLVAAVEERSEHHLGAAVVREASRRGCVLAGPVTGFHAHSGEGVHADCGARWVGVGREGLFLSHELRIPEAINAAAEAAREDGATALVALIREGTVVSGGVISVSDPPRAEAAAAVNALRGLGIRRVVVLTGDHARVGEAIRKVVGADEVRAGLLPDQKVVELRRLRNRGWNLAMVGDGVNDAPALATASVGIAMGGAGTDVALEVADVVLMKDDLAALPRAVWLSHRARRRIHQNLFLAFGMIILLLISSFFGLPLWLGVIGHEGSTVLVVLNGLRLLWDQPPAELDLKRTGEVVV